MFATIWIFILFLLADFVYVDSAGTYIFEDGIEYVWEKRSESTTPKGIVFLAHGCQHRATDWWPKSETCKKCIGLPVENKITTRLLEKGYVAVASSSSNNDHKCWLPGDESNIAKVIKQIYSFCGLAVSSVPLFLIGGKYFSSQLFIFALFLGFLFKFTASSGGSLVISFGLNSANYGLKVKAINPQIAGIHMGQISEKLPPTLFVHMERDKRIANAIARGSKYLMV